MKNEYSPIKKFRTSDLIVEEIWSAILRGDLNPGDRLPPERELVDQFEVSKVTLREALQKLEAYDLIERKRGAAGGSFVQEMAPTKGFELIRDYLNLKGFSLEDLILARTLIEPGIAERAARNINAKGIDELKLMLQKHEDEYTRMGRSKFGWHLEPLLARIEGNRILQVIEDLLLFLVKQIEAGLDQEDPEIKKILTEYYRVTYYEHKAIAEAVMRKDPEEAYAQMYNHRLGWAKLIRDLYSKKKIRTEADT
jgi:GntR family transcriptional regulator, transcriptional repressor for pyruvate dehydrogenase complex